MNIKKLLGQRLKEIRKNKKITQERLAELIGIDTSSISHIENGKYYPTAENLDKILEILDIKPNELFSFESYASHENLLNEMYESMKQNAELTKLMYKFYIAVK